MNDRRLYEMLRLAFGPGFWVLFLALYIGLFGFPSVTEIGQALDANPFAYIGIFVVGSMSGVLWNILVAAPLAHYVVYGTWSLRDPKYTNAEVRVIFH